MAGNENIWDTYQLLEQIGSGGGGTIYKAYHKRLHKTVVMKKLNNPGRSVIKNRQEVDILKNLKHTYLPQVVDFFESDEGVFTVMSYIPGKSFHELISEGKSFPRKDLLRWGMQLCSALNYLHTQKIPIIHGDIKPSNIMLTPENDICLIDFNISFYLDENTVLGYTDGYTSPEQYLAVSSRRKRGNSKFVIDQKADIYSVGATMYHMATGLKRADFNKEINMGLLTEAVGAPFAQIIAKAAETDPAKRYRSIHEMYEALSDLPKRDQRYRDLIKRQKIRTAVLAAAAVVFAGIACYGFLTMQDEKYDAYDAVVDEQIAFMEKGDFAASEEKYHEALELLPSELEAYYQQAHGLYTMGDYEECIAFIENEIINNEDVDKQGKRMVDAYALEGLCYIELGNGAAAVERYVKAVEYGAFEGDYYRDYAIALAYDNQFDKAQEMLDKAEEFGIDEASAGYTRGEIHYAKGEFDQALQEFKNCIQSTEDTYMCMRAYLMANKIYRIQGALNESRNLLTVAAGRLPVQQQPAILQCLIQTDIDLADKGNGGSYRNEAIGHLQTVISNGWAGYSDYDTLAILQQKQSDLAGVAATLETMRERYGEDYNIYKRYAFLEVERQEMKGQEARNYSDFLYYYNKATAMYDAEAKGNNTDQEMLLLYDVYGQLQTGGWL